MKALATFFFFYWKYIRYLVWMPAGLSSLSRGFGIIVCARFEFLNSGKLSLARLGIGLISASSFRMVRRKMSLSEIIICQSWRTGRHSCRNRVDYCSTRRVTARLVVVLECRQIVVQYIHIAQQAYLDGQEWERERRKSNILRVLLWK